MGVDKDVVFATPETVYDLLKEEVPAGFSESTRGIIEDLRRVVEWYQAPIDQTVEPVTLKLADGTPVMEVSFSNRAAWRESPVIYLDKVAAVNPHILKVLEGSSLKIVVVTTIDDLRSEIRERGMDERITLEKITGVAQGMRNDAEFPDLAEVLRAMPIRKLAKEDLKSSKRPALPKNRKRDRWN